MLAVRALYLFGLEAVADRLANVQLRLLIGNTTNRKAIEQIAEGYRHLEEGQHDLNALAFPKRSSLSVCW